MSIAEEPLRRIEHCFLNQRGNAKLSNWDGLNHPFVAKDRCKWSAPPKWFGRWHTVHTRMNRWAEPGVLGRVFAALQEEEIIWVRVEALSLDRTIVKVHPAGTGAEEKRPAIRRAIGWGSDDQDSSACRGCPARGDVSLSLGQAHDAPAGRELMDRLPAPNDPVSLLMDRANQGDQTRQLALDRGFTVDVPRLRTRTWTWC